MKFLKVTVLVLVLLLAMIVPTFAESGLGEAAEDQPLLYDEGEDGGGMEGNPGEDRDAIDYPDRSELHISTDLFLFSREIQNQLAEEGIKVIHTGAITEEKIEVGVYPDEAGVREIVLNLLIQNDIGEEHNFEIVYMDEVKIMPITSDDPSDPAPGPPDASSDPDTPVSNEEAESRIGGDDNELSDTEEDYVKPDDENAEIGITSVDDSAEDGEAENNNYIFPIAAVLGLIAIGVGAMYFKR